MTENNKTEKFKDIPNYEGMVVKIKNMIAEGKTTNDIKKTTGVSSSSINRIKCNKTYQSV